MKFFFREKIFSDVEIEDLRNLIEKNVQIILGPFFSSSLESITNIDTLFSIVCSA